MGQRNLSAVLKAVRELLDMGCLRSESRRYTWRRHGRRRQNPAELSPNIRNPNVTARRPFPRYVWTGCWQCVAGVSVRRFGHLMAVSVVLAVVHSLQERKENASTEDLVYLFDRAGIFTGVDLLKLVEVGLWISNELAKTNGQSFWSGDGSQNTRLQSPPSGKTRQPVSSGT